MRTILPALLLALSSSLTVRSPGQGVQSSGLAESTGNCGHIGSAYVRTTLYFGLTRPSGVIADAQWKAFLRTEVTPRFPQGLTTWEADGQWQRDDGRISRERAKVLLLVHDESSTTRAALQQIVQRYKASFQQQSVLWETARVCAAF
jgi:hypothetical protein